MIFKYLPPVLLLALVALPVRAELTLLSGLSIPGGGEVVAHYNNPSGPDYILVTDSLLRTNGTSHRIQILPLTATTPLLAASGSVANFDPIFGFDATLSVSSVAADPAGRGFGVASIIPTNSIGTRGRLAFFDLSNGSILRTVEVGFHPDAVKFTPDGTKVIVANEGEFKANAAHTPGSISVVSLTGINGVSSFSSVTPAVTTIDFNTGLATGVTLDGLRINVAGTAAADRYLHIEPEFPVATNDKAYVTLQENNAIATIDLTGASANKITAIKYLGTITQRIDASDRDPQNGGLAAININDVVPGLPMPDTLVTFMYRGRRLLATANEGDARTDDGDIARAGAADVVDTVSSGPTDAIFSGSISDSSGIGRLNISRVDGNTDDDALIEVPTMIGTRSFTLWDEAGTLVYDSGSAIEQFVRSNFPLTFNMNNGAASAIDSRSDDKGPEVEALAHGEINGRHYIFAGAERQNGVFQFDITDLNHVEIVGYYNVVDGVTVTTGTQFVSPETLVFVSAGESPTGRPLLIAGYEGVPDANINGSVAVFEVTLGSPGHQCFDSHHDGCQSDADHRVCGWRRQQRYAGARGRSGSLGFWRHGRARGSAAHAVQRVRSTRHQRRLGDGALRELWRGRRVSVDDGQPRFRAFTGGAGRAIAYSSSGGAVGRKRFAGTLQSDEPQPECIGGIHEFFRPWPCRWQWRHANRRFRAGGQWHQDGADSRRWAAARQLRRDRRTGGSAFGSLSRQPESRRKR